ncbi:MAG TPA: Holliday junction resolvase RuvX, partial [Deinococcales bacterium]|nr:Holliday junction resolvase RuvX [Deinococcales bacterium]
MTPPGPPPLPALALDVGQARIGLAVCDEAGRFTFGRGSLTRAKQAQDVQAVLEAMRREGARTLVIGLPRRTDGGDSPQTQRVRAFAQALAQAGSRT